MNRQQFNSRNDIAQVLTFQKSGATSSFAPSVGISGSRRVSWKLNNGSQITQIAGNSLSYTGFTSDTNIRNVEIRCATFKNITSFVGSNDNLYGNLDLSKMESLSSVNVIFNSNLTGITLSPLVSTTLLDLFTCGFGGNLDLSYLSGFGGAFSIAQNFNLTGITNPVSNTTFTRYEAWSCNLIGNLDLSMLTGLGGNLSLQNNTNLTGVTLPVSSKVFNRFTISNSNLKNNLVITGLTNLGGNFGVNSNSSLTGITHTATTINFTNYNVNNCNIIGTHDITMLSNLGGASTTFPCQVTFYSNPNLTDILFPVSTGYFRNIFNNEPNGAFGLYSCNLDYVDFKPLSGTTLISGATQGPPRISLRDNGMSATDVNHILVDFSGNTTSNPSGWSNVNLNIGGTNADPDSSSGGYDGIAAISFLTGSPYNWIITY